MPKGQDRTRRIGEQMRRDLAVAVPQILDHPHASLLSITAVRVTRDLSFAKVARPLAPTSTPSIANAT